MVIRFLLIMSIVFGFLNASPKTQPLKYCKKYVFLQHEKEVRNVWVVISQEKQKSKFYTVSDYIISENYVVFISNNKCIILNSSFKIRQAGKTIWD